MYGRRVVEAGRASQRPPELVNGFNKRAESTYGVSLGSRQGTPTRTLHGTGAASLSPRLYVNLDRLAQDALYMRWTCQVLTGPAAYHHTSLTTEAMNAPHSYHSRFMRLYCWLR